MKVLQAGIIKWLIRAFNTSILDKKRLEWVDYLRGIAIILVVYHHVRVGIERSNIVIPDLLVSANMIFYSFRMPLFFLLSGIFISRSLMKRAPGKIAWLKFENLLYPYLIWAFIQVTLQVIFGTFTNSNRGLVDYSYILYHPRNLDQFWYLPALFNVSVIFLLIKTKLRPTVPAQLFLGLVFYFLSPYFQKISMISDWMEFFIFFAIGDALSQLFFQESSQKIFKSARTFLMLIPIFIAVQLYYLKNDIGNSTLTTDIEHIRENYLIHMKNQLVFLFIALVGCMTMFNLAFLLQRWKIMRFLRVLGYHSLHIYVMHVIITGFIRLILPPVLGIHNPIVLLFTGIFFGVTIPVVVYNLLIKNKVGWFLFSYHKKDTPPVLSEPGPETITVKEVRPSQVVTS